MSTAPTLRVVTIGDNSPPPLAEILAETTVDLRREVEELAERANAAPRKIETDDDLDVVSLLVKDARGLARKVDSRRVAEKEPFLSNGRTVDAFFKAHGDRLDRIAATFQKIADDHAREKARKAREAAEAEARRLRAEEERKRQEAETARRASTQARKEAEANDLDIQASQAEDRAAAPVEEIVEKTTTASGVTTAAKEEWEATALDIATLDFEPLRYLIKRDAVEAAVRQFVRNGGRSLKGATIEPVVKARIR